MIAAFRTTRFRLPLASSIATAHGRIDARDGVLLELRTRDGAYGVGEAMPLAGFGLESLDESVTALARIHDALDRARPRSLSDALAVAEATAPEAPSARAAIDCALHDAFARRRGIPVAALLAGGATTHRQVPANGLVAIRDPHEAAAHARRLVERGYETLKVKIGGDLALDVARVAALRAAIGARIALRLDANGAWSECEAARSIARFAVFDPVFVEEPLATRDVEAWRRLAATSPIPLAADESVRDVESAVARVREGGARFVIVKPAVLGGLARAREVALAAQGAGARVVVTGFFDSAVGRAAALHLAASLPGPLEAAGLATSELLAADLATIASGPHCEVPRTPGLGIELDRAAVVLVAGRNARDVAA